MQQPKEHPLNDGLLALLRAGVTGRVDQKVDFSLCDWNNIECEAIKQGILPLVFDGLQKYHESLRMEVPTEIKLRWYSFVRNVEKQYERHYSAIRTLSDTLNGRGFRTMILKGYGLSLSYPIPSHRACEDIDIYQFGDHHECDDFLRKAKGVRIDASHHHHTVFDWYGVMVENHYDFVNVHTHPVNRKLEAYLKRLAEVEAPVVYNGVLLPSSNLALSFVFVHSAAHFAAESVGLRHIVDWYLLKQNCKNTVDWPLVEGKMEELGFGRFFRIWNEISEWMFPIEGQDGSLTPEGHKVLEEMLFPRFENHKGRKHIRWWLFRIKRWYGSRWKMKMVYAKESLLSQFIVHTISHFRKPERMLKKSSERLRG